MSDFDFNSSTFRPSNSINDTDLARADFPDVNYFDHYDVEGQHIDYDTPMKYLAARKIPHDDISPQELQAKYNKILGFYRGGEIFLASIGPCVE